MNLIPFVNLILNIINIYMFVLFAYVIVYYLIYFDVVNRYNKLVDTIYKIGFSLSEPIVSRIRKVIPPVGGVDISFIVLILLLHFTKDLLIAYFYQ